VPLCADKNDAVVQYTMNDANKQIFTSKYQLTLPTEEELKIELLREHAEISINHNLAGDNDFISDDEKKHPWRSCKLGYHLVNTYEKHVKPNKDHPDGTTVVHEHCTKNSSHQDILTYAEIQKITNKYFATLSGAPTSGVLEFIKEFTNGDLFDKQIRGWTRYWNEIFMPDNIIDGNLIKALIATESSFDEKSDKHPKNGHPRGLMQILDKTRQILGNHNGELHDNLVILQAEELFNPSANICAGIRWLFQKQYLLSTHLHRDVSWEEVIIEYKGYWDEYSKGNIPDAIKKLRIYYHILESGKTP
jgi:hypothetical protein